MEILEQTCIDLEESIKSLETVPQLCTTQEISKPGFEKVSKQNEAVATIMSESSASPDFSTNIGKANNLSHQFSQYDVFSSASSSQTPSASSPGVDLAELDKELNSIEDRPSSLEIAKQEPLPSCSAARNFVKTTKGSWSASEVGDEFYFDERGFNEMSDPDETDSADEFDIR